VLVEHLVLGGGVAGWIVGADAELAVAGDIEGLALSLGFKVRVACSGTRTIMNEALG
jgi:hypothetical protein